MTIQIAKQAVAYIARICLERHNRHDSDAAVRHIIECRAKVSWTHKEMLGVKPGNRFFLTCGNKFCFLFAETLIYCHEYRERSMS